MPGWGFGLLLVLAARRALQAGGRGSLLACQAGCHAACSHPPAHSPARPPASFAAPGCEIGVASTKAYTSQIVVITMMALALSEDSIAKRDLRDEILDSLAALPDAIRAALRLDGEMRSLAEALREEQSLLVFGRGFNYATALEAALKVKEVALMHRCGGCGGGGGVDGWARGPRLAAAAGGRFCWHARGPFCWQSFGMCCCWSQRSDCLPARRRLPCSEGILAGEMKHGPLALVDDTMPIIVIATGDNMHGKMLR